jgi:hypothetical protein
MRKANMRKMILLSLALVVWGCETHKCRYPTEGVVEIGEVKGKISYYGGQPGDHLNKYAFLSTINFSSMPTYHDAMTYMNNMIVKISYINSIGEYLFADVPLGVYYLNIGCFDNSFSSSFGFMSYHSITPYVVVKKGETFQIPDIQLLPGGKASLEWFWNSSDSLHQGFSFSKGANVSCPDSADLWYDGENQKLVTMGNKIAKMPGEPEGLCFISSAPDTGYYPELFIPFPEPGDTGRPASFHLVVKTQDGRYAKCRETGGEYNIQSDSVQYRRIDIQWMLQSDGSKNFSY